MFKRAFIAAATALALSVGTMASTVTPASAYVGFGLYFGGPYYGGPYYGYYHPYYYAPYYYRPYYYGYSYYPHYRYYGDDVASCAARFRTYNPATHLYFGYDGRWHHCP